MTLGSCCGVITRNTIPEHHNLLQSLKEHFRRATRPKGNPVGRVVSFTENRTLTGWAGDTKVWEGQSTRVVVELNGTVIAEGITEVKDGPGPYHYRIDVGQILDPVDLLEDRLQVYAITEDGVKAKLVLWSDLTLKLVKQVWPAKE